MHNWEDWKHSTGCAECRTERKKHVKPQHMLVGTVSGGFNSMNSDQYKFQSDFDSGLNAYKKARNEGLHPKATTTAAVDAAHREVKSQERAVQKMKKMGMDTKELRTLSGVKVT